MQKTFVIGDIHGAYRALKQCLERANFNYEKDHLISLGDVCDGWPETNESINELLKIKNLTYVLGNHDSWALEWMKRGFMDKVWIQQGGLATVQSYGNNVPDAHVELLEGALPYYIVGNKLFVHAGFLPDRPLEAQGLDVFLWDRSLARTALNFYNQNLTGKLTFFDEVFIGHTPVSQLTPVQSCEVWMMDTGAGWSGVLSMLNVHNKEIYSSDPVPTLYPGIQGRQKF